GSEDVDFFYCDIRPNGRIGIDPFGLWLSPSELLPPLPENEDQARRGWTVKEAYLDQTLRCRLLPESAGVDRRGVGGVRDTPGTIIYGGSVKDIVTFDTQRGLAEKIVSQSRSSKGNGEEEVVKLDEIKTHDADWVRRFSADAERYFPAQQAYQKVKEKRL